MRYSDIEKQIKGQIEKAKGVVGCFNSILNYEIINIIIISRVTKFRTFKVMKDMQLSGPQNWDPHTNDRMILST